MKSIVYLIVLISLLSACNLFGDKKPSPTPALEEVLAQITAKQFEQARTHISNNTKSEYDNSVKLVKSLEIVKNPLVTAALDKVLKEIGLNTMREKSKTIAKDGNTAQVIMANEKNATVEKTFDLVWEQDAWKLNWKKEYYQIPKLKEIIGGQNAWAEGIKENLRPGSDKIKNLADKVIKKL
jgi:hypothetical protein